MRLTTSAVATETNVSVQIQPALVSDISTRYVTDALVQVTQSGGQVRVQPKSLQRTDVTYSLGYGATYSGALMGSSDTRISVQPGTPPVLSQYAFYVSDPFGILDAYSSELTAAGVQLVLNTA